MSHLGLIFNVCEFGETFLHKTINRWPVKWLRAETPASDLNKNCKTPINFGYPENPV